MAVPSASVIKDVLLTSKKMLAVLWQEDKRTFIENVFVVLVPGVVPFVNAYVYAQVINFVVHAVASPQAARSYTHLYVLIAIRIAMLFVQDLAFTIQRRTSIILNTKIPLIFSQKIMNQLSTIDVELLEDSAFQDKFNNMINSFFISKKMIAMLA